MRLEIVHHVTRTARDGNISFIPNILAPSFILSIGITRNMKILCSECFQKHDLENIGTSFSAPHGSERSPPSP